MCLYISGSYSTDCEKNVEVDRCYVLEDFTVEQDKLKFGLTVEISLKEEPKHRFVKFSFYHFCFCHDVSVVPGTRVLMVSPGTVVPVSTEPG